MLLLRRRVVVRLRLWCLWFFRSRWLRMLRRFRARLLLRLRVLRVLLRRVGLRTSTTLRLVLRVRLLLIVVPRLRCTCSVRGARSLVVGVCGN